MSVLLECRDVTFAYREGAVLRGVDFSLERGELVALVGPNGAGKSTLLHVLLGLLRPTSGTVSSLGEPLLDLGRRDIALRMAFVPQSTRTDFAFTVRELVAMGRMPHLGRFEPEGKDDLAAIERALVETETRALEDRLVSELSGGERQRVHVARAIAQSTDVLLLDEPTASLDVAHQLEILGLIAELTRNGRAAVVALHDLSLAARFATRIVGLSEGRVVANGRPEAVLTEAFLEAYFRIHARVERDPRDGTVVVVPLESTAQKPGARTPTST
jgi:iron complex transport system ATP-binding protein